MAGVGVAADAGGGCLPESVGVGAWGGGEHGGGEFGVEESGEGVKVGERARDPSPGQTFWAGAHGSGPGSARGVDADVNPQAFRATRTSVSLVARRTVGPWTS
jgi:hypothetical protein